MIDYEVILQIILQLNSFAENADETIKRTWAKHDSDQSQLAYRHGAAVRQLGDDYRKNKSALEAQARKILQEAEAIHGEISQMDATLTTADKYYTKTKKKKEEELAGKQSEQHMSDTDFFVSLKAIRSQFQILSDKYSKDILPALINGLNYLFSSKRKGDYEELIVLKNTVETLIAEINRMLPELTRDSTSDLSASYTQGKRQLDERNVVAGRQLSQRYAADTETLAELICEQLDEILPDEILSRLAEVTARYYINLCKVNVSAHNDDAYFVLGFLDYPLELYVQSPILSTLIRDKCTPILVDGHILRFPIICPKAKTISLMIKNDGSSVSDILNFTHSIMLEFLSAVPITQLTYSIIDPENRGNSITPFFDIRKKLPELFDNKIFIARDEIYEKLNGINEYIEETLQNRVGSRYETIFDYEKDVPDYHAPIQLLLIYDFPKGFDDTSFAALRNIIRNGHKCGIYVLIYHDTINGVTGYSSTAEATQLIEEMCAIVQQNGSELFFSGLDVSYPVLPQKHTLGNFFNKYLLIYEGIKNKGLAFPAIIKKMMDSTDPAELEHHIRLIVEMMQQHESCQYHVPQEDAAFPQNIVLGTVDYPMDIFSDSFGFEIIKKTFGSKRENDDGLSTAELPLTCDLAGTFNLLLNCPEAASRETLAFTHHVVWEFLSALPIAKVNLCIFDGEMHGNSIAPFLDFKKHVPEIFDQQIYTSQDEMTSKLDKLNRSIAEFIQDKLSTRYANLLEYNINTPKRAEAITLLLIYDFPRGFDSRNIDLLLNILKNGSKCGIYTIMCYNPSIQYSRYDSIEEKLEDIMKFCATVEYRDRTYMLLPYNLPIKIKPPMTANEVEKFIDEYRQLHEKKKKQGLSFDDILSRDLFASNSSKNLTIPIGIGDGDSIVKLVFGEGSSHHGLIAGATGSGKSTLLHTLIMSGMLHHTPEQLHLYLMDFKSGTEFKIYESVKLPHIQLLALDAMQEFGESILEDLVQEMTRRSKLFKDAGQTSLNGYLRETGQPMPRILVIMDEFQILFNDSANRKVAMNCAELTKRIVTEGRAFGIHLLMATQTTKAFSDLTLSHGTIEQMRVRIGLKCGEDDARYLFSDRNDAKALEMMKGPIGTAVMNLEYMESSNVGLRAAYCDKESQQKYLEKIAYTFSGMQSKLQIFEGNRTTPLLDFFASSHIGLSDAIPAVIYLGSLIKVAPPLAIRVDRRRKHNLLVCGANERMSENITNSYMLSALLHTNSKVYCIDGEYLVGDSASEDIYITFERFGGRFQLATDRGQIVKFVNDIFTIYTERKRQNSDQQVFVFIKDLQFLDIVRKMFADEFIDESEFADYQSSPANTASSDDPTGFGFLDNQDTQQDIQASSLSLSAKMQKLIDDGSGFGISFVVSSTEYQVVKESMHFGGQILPKFPERIIFSLNDNDADNLIDNVAVSNLRDNTVYFTDGIKNTFQMKPYVMPSVVELECFVAGLLDGDHG